MTNGAVERANGSLVSIFCKIASSDPIHWPSYLNAALLAYQVSHHQIIGMSPFKALYSRNPILPLSFLTLLSAIDPGSADAGMHLIASKHIRLQALTANLLFKTTSCKYDKQNAL